VSPVGTSDRPRVSKTQPLTTKQDNRLTNVADED
jgi:hypothetical protein